VDALRLQLGKRIVRPGRFVGGGVGRHGADDTSDATTHPPAGFVGHDRAVHITDLFSIDGKIALVTGGSRGIGEMIAAGFLANGAKVYISSRKADACEATAQRLIDRYGGECVALPADLSGLAGAAALAEALGEREERLDILVNNAGVAWGAPFEEFPEKGWDKVMDTNVKGPFFVIQQLMPLLTAAASASSPARIINIGSIDGSVRPACRPTPTARRRPRSTR
jgi:NAD(P)-dependent dehydrogenase (short-subunit alcohol dehydrogenase family)